MATQQSLPDTTAGLYNTLCAALHISNQQFQMIQGVLPVQSDAAGLYNYIDGIPPKSVATLYTSNPLNTLNGNIQNLLNDAKPGFLTQMAMTNYMNSAYWVNGAMSVNPVYTPTFSDLFNQVAAGSSATINFDSANDNSDISTSWAASASSAGVGFWGTSSSSVSQSLNASASAARITVDITFDKYAYLAVRAGGWFTPGFFSAQYQNVSNWTGGQSQWNTIFGPSGSCQNVANQVLLVNGYTITTTSYATYSEADFNMIQQSSETNVFPFYTSSSNSSATQSHHQNADQSITTIVTQKPGTLQIFGIGVIPTAVAVGGGGTLKSPKSKGAFVQPVSRFI
jgi:hypothetical protein